MEWLSLYVRAEKCFMYAHDFVLKLLKHSWMKDQAEK